MYEVELKVRADHGPVRERLAELDGTHLGTVAQVDTYYDAPHRDFGETDEALRLRRVDTTDGEGSARLTYKGPLLEAASKTREEVELAVSEPGAMAELLGRLGFAPAATVRKERDRYDLDGYRVALDDVEGLGEFVEVEAGADDEAIDPVREGARETLARLGLDPTEQIRTSYLDLLAGDE